MRVLIIDDEKQAREGVQILLQPIDDIEVVGEAKDGEEAISQITKHKPDLIFLDVQMPGINGFDVLGSIQESDIPIVIFTTAYDQYALKAFEVQALDYLLKPLSEERFIAAIARAKKHYADRQESDRDTKIKRLIHEYQQEQKESSLVYNRQNKQMVIKASGKIYFIQTDDVIWVEAMDSYVKIHLAGKTHIVKASLQSLEQRYKHSLTRIHRSYLVNLRHVKYIEPDFHGDFFVMVHGELRLKGSRNFRKNLPEIL
ncbi:MAG: LytTR family DNA-binding domain-containing protein [Reichenbachiella sp.]|uniref:LytR/AlgR family response regulator transcription factor n=1 Tax=Reichenbachiella sp. TaxID=2184521 RepID=UPI003264205F